MKRYNLVNFRKRKELTQKEMADKLEVAKSTYVNIERGVSHPSWGVMQRFADVFQLDEIWCYFKKFQ